MLLDIQYQVMLDSENEEKSSHVIGYKDIIQVEEVEKKRRGLLKPSRILAELLETNSHLLRIALQTHLLPLSL